MEKDVDNSKKVLNNLKGIIDTHFDSGTTQSGNMLIQNANDVSSEDKCRIINGIEDVVLSNKQINLVFNSLVPLYSDLKSRVNRGNVGKDVTDAYMSLEFLLYSINPVQFSRTFKK